MNPNFEQPFVKEGWVCPLCRRVFSPDTPWCLFCGGEARTYTTSSLNINNQPIEEFVNIWTGEKYPLNNKKEK